MVPKDRHVNLPLCIVASTKQACLFTIFFIFYLLFCEFITQIELLSKLSILYYSYFSIASVFVIFLQFFHFLCLFFIYYFVLPIKYFCNFTKRKSNCHKERFFLYNNYFLYHNSLRPLYSQSFISSFYKK